MFMLLNAIRTIYYNLEAFYNTWYYILLTSRYGLLYILAFEKDTKPPTDINFDHYIADAPTTKTE